VQETFVSFAREPLNNIKTEYYLFKRIYIRDKLKFG